eukprot:gene27732-7378_t
MQCVYSPPATRQFAHSRSAPSHEAKFSHAGRQSRRALIVSCRASGATNPHSPKVGAVAIDVEFCMIKCTDGCIINPAAQVCLVDEAGNVLLKTYCRDEAALDEAEKSIGGVPLSSLHGAPSLEEGKGGNARTLKLLASTLLGISIQKKRHDAEEDARAVMSLYMDHVRAKMLDYDDLVLHYAQQMKIKKPQEVEEEEEEINT